MTTLLLVDDDPFNREAMCFFLRSKRVTILEAGDATTAWEIASTQRLDVAIIDIVIPLLPLGPVDYSQSLGIELVTRIKSLYPTLGIVLFSAYEDRLTGILDLVNQGVHGIVYKLKGCQPDALWQAIEEVQRGGVKFDPGVTNQRHLLKAFLDMLKPEEKTWVESAAALIPTLSPREFEVAQMVAAAHTSESIAQKLVIALKSVETYITKIYNKLGLKDAFEGSLPLRKSIILAKALMLHQLK